MVAQWLMEHIAWLHPAALYTCLLYTGTLPACAEVSPRLGRTLQVNLRLGRTLQEEGNSVTQNYKDHMYMYTMQYCCCNGQLLS